MYSGQVCTLMMQVATEVKHQDIQAGWDAIRIADGSNVEENNKDWKCALYISWFQSLFISEIHTLLVKLISVYAEIYCRNLMLYMY